MTQTNSGQNCADTDIRNNAIRVDIATDGNIHRADPEKDPSDLIDQKKGQEVEMPHPKRELTSNPRNNNLGYSYI